MTTTESSAASGRVLDFTEYVTARRPHLLRDAYAITHNRDIAEELLQTALARVFAHWPTIRSQRTADAYVHRTMVTMHDSWSRQQHSREDGTAEPPGPPMPWPAAAEPSWDRWELWSLVTALPPSQRAAVVLCYFEELSGREAAAVLDCSVGTVRSNASRALATLRRLAGDTRMR